jgi:exopolysaccharide production protein ExoY
MEAHMASLLEPHSTADMATETAHADLQDDEAAFIRPDRNQGTPFSLAAAEPLVISALLADADKSGSASLKAKISQATFRVVDVTLAGTLLILTSPIMITCWLSVKLSGPGQALFRHMRIGKNGQPFACYKFRTMVNGAEAMLIPLLNDCDQSRSEWAATQKLQNDPRITRVGRVLRRYSLDELPQLFNVLIGNMSFVGPRPIVKEEIVRYGEFFLDYCSVKPGLSGLWQVSGKNSLSYEERVRLDTQYARSKSVWKDIVILWRTIPVVLLGRSS